MVPLTIHPEALLARQQQQRAERRSDTLHLMAASPFPVSSSAHRMALLSPSSSRPILVRLPVRVNPDLRAPVPAYWREMSSPWSAHRILKRCSTCRQSCMIQGQGGPAPSTSVCGVLLPLPATVLQCGCKPGHCAICCRAAPPAVPSITKFNTKLVCKQTVNSSPRAT